MDIYVVLDGSRVVGASARLQGAELIRAHKADAIARRRVDGRTPPLDEAGRLKAFKSFYNEAYGRMRIENVELQDMDD